jgi:hypothetical protein
VCQQFDPDVAWNGLTYTVAWTDDRVHPDAPYGSFRLQVAAQTDAVVAGAEFFAGCGHLGAPGGGPAPLVPALLFVRRRR